MTSEYWKKFNTERMREANLLVKEKTAALKKLSPEELLQHVGYYDEDTI